MTVRVREKLPEGQGALLKVDGLPPKDIHERKPLGRTETRSPIMDYTVSSHMLGSNLIHTTTTEKQNIIIK